MPIVDWPAALARLATGWNPPSPFPVRLLSEICGVTGKEYLLELAGSPDERARGLGGRSMLPANRGMIFLSESPAAQSFWMKDVQFPLTALFFDEKGILLSAADMPVEADPSSPRFSYQEQRPVSAVVEIAGLSARTWKPGKTLLYVRLPD